MSAARKALLLLAVLPAACEAQATTRARSTAAAIDADRLLADVRALSADSMDGRRAGSPGGAMARHYLEQAFRDAGIEPFGSSFDRPFPLGNGDSATGVNLVGRIAGREAGRVILVTAHYDHLGSRQGQIFNGADDNASGTAAILAVARALSAGSPAHTFIFAALDAEEQGLRGAHAFVANPPVPLETIAIEINLDMVSRNDKGELWVAGTRHYPFLLPFVETLAADVPVTLRVGHDLPGTGSDDWTDASDHGPFHKAGIPFLYFGVEDHPDYHRPSDDFERIEPTFFTHAVETILASLRTLDRDLDTIVPRR